MKNLEEILRGYCDPDQEKHAINAVGDTGLRTRIRSLCYFDAAIKSMIREHFYEFGREHFGETLWPILQMLRQSWATEFMRIMDNARTGKKENLTIRLLHERLQLDQTIPTQTKQDEQQRFEALDAEYVRHDLWRIRCEEIFHLDLARNRQPPRSGGPSIAAMTALVLSWYVLVEKCVTGVEPRYVTEGGHTSGKSFAKQLRKMMSAQIRLWNSRANP